MFFCQHYSFNTTEDMITAGLHVTDLSLFDSSSNFLVHGTNQERELKAIVHRVGYISVYFNFYKSIDWFCSKPFGREKYHMWDKT